MNVSPARVTLAAWETQLFQVEENGQPIPETPRWLIVPAGRGTIESSGAYTAPRLVFVPRHAVITATVTRAGGDVTLSAVVELSNARTWIVSLSAFLTVFSAAVLTTLLLVWPRALPSTHPLAVGPSKVVLKKGETQTFFASAPVKWPGSAPGGVFTATADSGTTQIGLTKAEGGDSGAQIVIDVNDTSLSITPALPTLHTGESVQLFATTDAKGALSWQGEFCTKSGLCTAPTVTDERIFLATVTTETPTLTASIPIRLVPTGPDTMTLLIIAMLFGALGGLLHATNSLVAYVGSSKFVGSWGLFYLARPFVGATMALLVFLVFKGQLTTETLKTTEPIAVAAIAGLVGLFSDLAAEKLREIFDAVLGPKSDPRANKLGTNPVVKPSITSIAPQTLKVGAPPPTLVVQGSAFGPKAKGQVNGADRTTTAQSDKQVTIALTTADVAVAGTLAVTIVTAAGDMSQAFSVTVGP